MRLPREPKLTWTDEGVPRAEEFADTYFSRLGGLAESEAVFLAGCGLPEAWKGRAQFFVAELGFGAGLNALALWRAWRAAREPNAVLHLVSIEAFPLKHEDARRALAAFPEIDDLAEKLLARWPARAYGPQRLWFDEDGFALTLIVGEAGQVLAGLEGSFDAWFLDGFAPARNAAMWTNEIFHHMRNLSAPHARAATFSVAGEVRRGLEAAGFSVEKKPGFAAKRERLEAWLSPALADAPDKKRAPARRHQLYPSGGQTPKRVAIIGAGIAGAAAAAALVRRKAEVIVLEAAPSLGAGASGNSAALVAPRLDRDASGVSEFFLAAYLYAIAAYHELGEGVFTPTGLEERPGARTKEVLEALLNDPPLAEDWLKRVGQATLFYPQAGVLKPRAAVPALLRGAILNLERPVVRIEPGDEGWRLIGPGGEVQCEAGAVVLACGAGLCAFESFLPLQFSRGQIEWGPLDGKMPHALLGSSYAAPYDAGLVFGATFDRVDDKASPLTNPADRLHNLAALGRLAPEIAARIDGGALCSRASLRVSTQDRAPIAGLLPDAPAWLAQNRGLAHGRPPPDLPAPALSGVYVTGALGARGFTLAPLIGELLAGDMFCEPAFLSPKARAALHPARFLHRALKKDATMRGRRDGVRD
jgi:tRNA 5-methylaminomethyl-2-thiouridine biosynthesis bifunctional protein